ncbi:MAG: protein kinase domain-containing protein [Polyangia bacterium]
MESAVRRWFGATFAGERDAPFADEIAAVNRRRLLVMAPLMTLVHLAHVTLFHVSSPARATLSADVVRWRDGLVVAHGWMIVYCVVVGTIAWRTRRPLLLRLLGPLTATAYLVHGAICTGLDQIVVSNVTAYVGYCIGIAVIIALTPLTSIVAYAIGAAALVTAMLTFQRSAGARLSSLPNCATLTLVGVTISWILYAARRRELQGKRVIDRQREELAELNAGLERRVEAQVAEIVERAHEVAELNAQLQAQVVARSRELSLALSKLAKQREGEAQLGRGTVLGGRFVVEEIIGQGGMGAVYAGVDRGSGARVAIKVIQATSSRQLDALRRFIREAGATATVNHPAVVRMLHVDVSDDGMLFQVMELVEGETLTRRLTRLAARRSGALVRGARRRARGGARARRGAPRRQAGQRHADDGGAGPEAARLRHRQALRRGHRHQSAAGDAVVARRARRFDRALPRQVAEGAAERRRPGARARRLRRRSGRPGAGEAGAAVADRRYHQGLAEEARHARAITELSSIRFPFGRLATASRSCRCRRSSRIRCCRARAAGRRLCPAPRRSASSAAKAASRRCSRRRARMAPSSARCRRR